MAGSAPRDPFADFKHVCMFDMGLGGVDADIRTGLSKFRWASHRWLLHDTQTFDGVRHRIEQLRLKSDLVIGHLTFPEQAHYFEDLGIPVLDLKMELDRPDLRTHTFDFQAIGRFGAEYFRNLKHRNFAFVSSSDHMPERRMWEGFRQVVEPYADSLVWIQRMAGLKIDVLPKPQTSSYTTHTEGLPGFPQPLAVLASSDRMAATVANASFFLGVSVPEEVSLLGVGNLEPICEGSFPTLSSIQLPGERLGYLIGEHVEQLFQGETPEQLAALKPIRVVERHSCGQDAVQDPVVAKALSLMRSNATRRITIGDIADLLPISKRSFLDRFTRAVGRSPREELQCIRLSLARGRLLTSDHTVMHVALDCGFSDADSMVRAFKKQYGLTPSQFRKENGS